MLQTATVSESLLEFLKELMISPLFSDYILVGGTALALQIGHRNSIDIDLFGSKEIDGLIFKSFFKSKEISLIQESKNILVLKVDNIKIDFVNYKYPLLDDISTIDNIRLASLKDIAAMKLSAIAGRGSKKDFVDLYYLLNYFTLEQMITFYNTKYNDGSEFLVRKSLTYFEDADSEPMPRMMNDITWEDIKSHISKINDRP